MSLSRSLVLGMLVLAYAGGARADEKFSAEKLMGSWKCEKANGAAPPAEVVADFLKDGKFKLHVKSPDGTMEMEGTYKIEGDKLIVTLDSDKTDPHKHTLKKLTDKELVILHQEGHEMEFSKVEKK